MNRTWTDDQFIRAAAGATSIADALRSLGLCPRGRQHRAFHRHAKRLGVSLAHYDLPANQRRALVSFTQQFTDTEVFVVDSPLQGTGLKRRVHEAGFLPNRCAECDNAGTHNGKPLVLQLDHINGVRTDNRRENLRFLCPNCHSQTATYCGKNLPTPAPKRKVRAPQPRKVDYDAVRARFAVLGNYSAVAREFNVSDPLIHKIVKGAVTRPVVA